MLKALIVAAALPDSTPAQATVGPRPRGRIAACFGSGSLHGYAHVGAFRAFQKLGLKPAVITGTSFGAIAGVLWAAGLSADAIETIAYDDSWRQASSLRIPVLGLGRLDGLRLLINRHTEGRSIEGLPTPAASISKASPSKARCPQRRNPGARIATDARRTLELRA